ncbi:hypothetical protein B566_EDAN001309 [Ephemera danica]|nr:hypothetical protein B566_EDAN001309 [Ephemera danica]
MDLRISRGLPRGPEYNMRTLQIVFVFTAVCAGVLSAAEPQQQQQPQGRRQALFVRQQRQQPASSYQSHRPEKPFEEEPHRVIRAAQNLPLENVFRWFRGQFADSASTSGRKARGQEDQQGNSAVNKPSLEYLPLPSVPSEKPRPFVPPVTSTASAQRPTQRPIQTIQTTVNYGGDEDSSGSATSGEEHHHHGAHIDNIDVTCAKDQMTIRLQFSGPFEGVIYSKGFYNQPNCRYLQQGSNQNNAEFTVRLDSCGTQFVDEFASGGQAYLENVLVLQNEVGIQEVWDTIRRVRCLWAGNINKALSASLNVDVLDQEIVTFSGDTASARLDIQVGEGPFATPVSGLVKIGETMTLVVSVEGDAGFEVSVGECVAHAGDRDKGGPIVKLTDADGCPLKTKFFPKPFKTTRETGRTGASIIAYAVFQAFKFPDQMELYIECEVELCKTGCRVCPRVGNNRRKRASNDTEILNTERIADPVRLMRKLRVVTDDDLALLEDATGSAATIINVASQQDGVCMSMGAFVTGSLFLLVLLISSSLVSACLWLKNQRLQSCGM